MLFIQDYPCRQGNIMAMYFINTKPDYNTERRQLGLFKFDKSREIELHFELRIDSSPTAQVMYYPKASAN